MTEQNQHSNKKTKNPYYNTPQRIYDRDIVSELLSEAHEPVTDCRERCIYCGYEISDFQSAVEVIATGDIIHEECWQSYAEETFDELCVPLSYSCDKVPEGIYEEE